MNPSILLQILILKTAMTQAMRMNRRCAAPRFAPLTAWHSYRLCGTLHPALTGYPIARREPGDIGCLVKITVFFKCFVRKVLEIVLKSCIVSPSFGNQRRRSHETQKALVAQSDRASVYGTEGLGFESLQARFFIVLFKISPVFLIVIVGVFNIMSHFFDMAVKRASENLRTIVLPEGEDQRTIDAAAKILELGFANIILLGDVDDITARLKEAGGDPSKLQIFNPATDSKLNEFAGKFYEYRKHKGVTEEQAAQMVTDEIYFGTMLVKEGYADGLVAGACHSSADTIRPALQIIKPVPGLRTISSTFFMCLGEETYLFSDCALVQNPTAAQLCDIAVETTKTAFLFGFDPRVALLSYSTKGSGSGDGVDKVAHATDRAKETIFALFGAKVPVDGELQFDSAFVPSVAELKCPDSPLKGNANVFIFPDLGAGNICYKAVQRMAKAEAFGPVLQGLAKPVNDLSRGCDAHDIVATTAVTAIQATL